MVRSGRRVVCLTLISSLVISLDRFVVDSLALQILMHFSRVNFGSASSFFLVLLSERPKTILSRSRLFFSPPKLHVFTKEHKEVKYVSNDSPCMLLVAFIKNIPFVGYRRNILLEDLELCGYRFSHAVRRMASHHI